jgi:hypothetical protein
MQDPAVVPHFHRYNKEIYAVSLIHEKHSTNLYSAEKITTMVLFFDAL